MRGNTSLIKIAMLCVAMAAVPDCTSAFAQGHGAANVGRPAVSFQGRPAVAGNRGLGHFERFDDSFRGWSRFGGAFDRGRGFGTNIVVVPNAVAPPYAGPPLGYDALGCVLHRPVQTPYGTAMEPVYVC